MSDMLQLVVETGKAQCAIVTGNLIAWVFANLDDKLKHIGHLVVSVSTEQFL